MPACLRDGRTRPALLQRPVRLELGGDGGAHRGRSRPRGPGLPATPFFSGRSALLRERRRRRSGRLRGGRVGTLLGSGLPRARRHACRPARRRRWKSSSATTSSRPHAARTSCASSTSARSNCTGPTPSRASRPTGRLLRVRRPGRHERPPRLFARLRRAATRQSWDRYQRVSVDNLSTGQTWSADVENPWSGGAARATGCSGSASAAGSATGSHPLQRLRARLPLDRRQRHQRFST